MDLPGQIKARSGSKPVKVKDIFKANTPERRRTTLYVDSTLWKKIRLTAIEEGTSASLLTERLYEKYLSEHNKVTTQ